MKLSCGTFRSIKPHSIPNPNPNRSPKSLIKTADSNSNSNWCAYLIASTNPPFKTYVGVTTDFDRRLKQHNGELKGGAKACRAGRPWLCACIVHGFINQSQACEFESKWKNLSRKLPRKQSFEEKDQRLLNHRYAAMDKLKDSFGFAHLQVDWKLTQPPFDRMLDERTRNFEQS